ncbi:LacI family DNA-binding transcriptional regulator [Vreelandella malpeensis]|uniref:LacI family DNA-binding transcriptional regulator n=1 Tax=Vreelandella malpeensis TaxID=1172368 RepID=A0ABS8DPR6_9GAMM|nr:LacI family DNA-binding transcriptional regulator [Halomonas malpeensis]MCB8888135.1 LacI family DNA-binding transcriptional regulator [Halomonas malpeensis]
MKKRPVTSRQVAELAGVSQSAVSRCFSPKASIAPKTREKVLAAARELGYRPNSIARSLITRSSRTIAVVMSQLDNPFYAQMLDCAARQLQQHGYHLLLFMSRDDEQSSAIMADILQRQADGILMLAARLSSSFAQECVERGIPVALINRTVTFEGVSQVASDNHRGGYWAGEWLIARGYERIAFVAGVAQSSTSNERREGFLAALADHGHHCWAEESGDYQRTAAQAATRALFTRTPPPDAIFAANDHMAVAVIDTLRAELGLRVPEDVGVVGFDNMPVASWPSYRLTTIQQPLEEMVTHATQRLLEQIETGIVTGERKRLPVVPIVRGSTR